MSDRRDLAIVLLSGGLLFCLGLLLGQGASLLPQAGAQGGVTIDTPVGPVNIPSDPFSGNRPRITDRLNSRTVASQASDSDSNNRFVAVTIPIGSGDSVLALVDTQSERLLMYRYLRSKGGGLQLVAARQLDFDLRLSGYQDRSEYTRDELRKEYEKSLAKIAAKAAKYSKGKN
ncbi:MAG: hypothetical protein O7C98_09830 [Planctomycetota bacterium]|nr:hypothetical protein [Planctomycetota bacterium]